MRSIAFALAGLFLAAAPFVAAAADDAKPAAPKIDDAERTKIESVIHDYLLQHPDVIVKAVSDYQDKLQADKDKAAQDVAVKRSDDLLHDSASQVFGNLQSDCTIVEFFDNQCPYCQANEPDLQKLLKQDEKVKLILKEFPILGPTSVVAAEAALASVKQDKYAEFHEALLAHKGHYKNDAVVDDVAKSIGLDLDKLHKDMAAPEIQAEIGKNLDLGRDLNIDGTPGFVIGKQIISGASTIDELKKYLADSCKG